MVDLIQPLATPTTQIPVLAFEEIDSTNAEARRRAETGEVGPLWITALRQSAGRGRRGRSWNTGTGNLAATLLMTTDLPPGEAAQISFVAALAVADLARTFLPADLVRLKWPNDLMVGARKAAGILVESGRRPDGRLWLAAGIGVNLAHAPDDTERPAPSFAANSEQPPPTPLEALDRLSEAFTGWLNAWSSRGFSAIAEAWTIRAQGLGQPCIARLGSETIEGVAEGLDVDGALRMRLADGAIRRITAGDVFFEGREMLLAIEQGNTNTLFAVHDGQEWIAQWRTATDSMRTADEYAVWLHQLMEMQHLKLSNLNACIVSSVVPQSIFNLRNLARRYLHVEPLVVGENAELGVEVRIEKPSEAGADRLVNAVGAHVAYPGALLVIDSGTATTFDVVGADGGFEGGAIAPGINLSMQALHEAAARLPRVAIQKPARVVGRGTVEAMQAGVFWGYVGLIEGLTDRIRAEYGEPLTVIATGGVASLFAGATPKIDVFDHDLTIRGLLEIYHRNCRAPGTP